MGFLSLDPSFSGFGLAYLQDRNLIFYTLPSVPAGRDIISLNNSIYSTIENLSIFLKDKSYKEIICEAPAFNCQWSIGLTALSCFLYSYFNKEKNLSEINFYYISSRTLKDVIIKDNKSKLSPKDVLKFARILKSFYEYLGYSIIEQKSLDKDSGASLVFLTILLLKFNIISSDDLISFLATKDVYNCKLSVERMLTRNLLV